MGRMEEAIEKTGRVLLEVDNSHFHKSKSRPFQEESLISSSTMQSMSSSSSSSSSSFSSSSSSSFSSSKSAKKELMELFDRIQREIEEGKYNIEEEDEDKEELQKRMDLAQ